MNNLFNSPKYNADGSINPKHKLSVIALVLSESAADHKLHPEAVLAQLRQNIILSQIF